MFSISAGLPAEWVQSPTVLGSWALAAFATRGLCADLFAHVLLEHDLLVGDVVMGELRAKLRTRVKLPKKTIDEIEALWSAIDERDDWQPLCEKLAAIARAGEAFGNI